MDSVEEQNHPELKEFILAILKEREKLTDFRFKAADDALKVSKEVLEKDLKHLNELRTEVITDRNIFLKRDEYAEWKEQINRSVTQIKTAVNIRTGLAILVALITVIIMAVK